MGAHHVLDYVCDGCHQYDGEIRKHSCIVCHDNGCEECLYPVDENEWKEYKNIQELDCEDDELWSCDDCVKVIKQMCNICKALGCKDLITCYDCNKEVCKLCSHNDRCWDCSRDDLIEKYMKQLGITSKKAAMESLDEPPNKKRRLSI